MPAFIIMLRIMTCTMAPSTPDKTPASLGGLAPTPKKRMPHRMHIKIMTARVKRNVMG